MTTKLVHVLALLLALVAGFFAWQQWDRERALKKQVDSLTAEVANKDALVQEQFELLARLQEENDVFSNEVASLRAKVTPTQPKSANADQRSAASESGDGATKVFRRMSKDPKLKEIGDQWRSNRVKRIYGDFAKARQLNPQQATQFFDLLAKEESRKRDEESSLYGGDGNEEASPKQTEQQFAMQKADIERQLKLLLGDNDYAAYEEYKKTAPQRSALLRIHEDLARNNTPLSAEQAEALLQIMLEEHSQRILNRVETILTAEQHQELERFQDQQDEIERARIEAAREMVSPNKSITPGPTISPPSR